MQNKQTENFAQNPALQLVLPKNSFIQLLIRPQTRIISHIKPTNIPNQSPSAHKQNKSKGEKHISTSSKHTKLMRLECWYAFLLEQLDFEAISALYEAFYRAISLR
jgi:DNA topoisomerase VI subunit A